jgi:hypothetical protein
LNADHKTILFVLLPANVASRALAGTVVAVCLLSAMGCFFVPVRVPTQTRGVSGEAQKLDFTFLKNGSTTREEVNQRLTVIDTGVKQQGLFWGRWETSTWGYGIVGLTVPPGGARYWGNAESADSI